MKSLPVSLARKKYQNSVFHVFRKHSRISPCDVAHVIHKPLVHPCDVCDVNTAVCKTLRGTQTKKDSVTSVGRSNTWSTPAPRQLAFPRPSILRIKELSAYKDSAHPTDLSWCSAFDQ
ncbi:hypothetical protein EVAR_97812_1 [Eumeta japonica]|uniref:Uncharacterized protein n=1 Tax=Eumeta variegata TaxID=151549 RepID=A0A4C1XE76_EUMVA|nr:hypothetical protein EVAR_97812_1 [Eumeta japonica]